VRDSSTDGLEVKKGQFIGLAEGKLSTAGAQLEHVTGELLDTMVEEDSSLVSLFFGAEVSSDKADEIMKMLGDKYPDIDFEMYYGGQPLYHFLISVE